MGVNFFGKNICNIDWYLGVCVYIVFIKARQKAPQVKSKCICILKVFVRLFMPSYIAAWLPFSLWCCSLFLLAFALLFTFLSWFQVCLQLCVESIEDFGVLDAGWNVETRNVLARVWQVLRNLRQTCKKKIVRKQIHLQNSVWIQMAAIDKMALLK